MHNELTQKDLQLMREELDHRRIVLRPQLLEAVKEARSFGDLSENFEYKAAKRDKNRNDSRCRYLENMIKTARVIEDHSAADTVGLYDKVTIWLEEGGEPSEHVLNELLLHRAALDALPVRLIFLLRSRESLEHPALAGRLSGWNRVQLLLDDWAYDLELLARHLACDPDSPPLAVACDGEGRAVYSLSGYRAGSVELLVRVAAHLCPGA